MNRRQALKSLGAAAALAQPVAPRRRLRLPELPVEVGFRDVAHAPATPKWYDTAHRLTAGEGAP